MTINIDASAKNIICVKNIIFGLLLHLAAKMVNIDVLLTIKCDEIIEETKTIPTNFNAKKVACRTQYFCILLVFLLITIVLLIDVTIYCYLIKYQAKQKH